MGLRNLNHVKHELEQDPSSDSLLLAVSIDGKNIQQNRVEFNGDFIFGKNVLWIRKQRKTGEDIISATFGNNYVGSSTTFEAVWSMQ